jgi:hypothetical protein
MSTMRPREDKLEPIEGSSNLFQKIDRREAIRVVNAPSPDHHPGCSASSPVPATSFGAVSTSLRAQGGHR